MRLEGQGATIAIIEVQKIIKLTNPNGVIVFAEGDSFHSAPWKGYYPIHAYTPKSLELNFSKKTLVILICNFKSIRVRLNNEDGCFTSGFELLASNEKFFEINLKFIILLHNSQPQFAIFFLSKKEFYFILYFYSCLN